MPNWQGKATGIGPIKKWQENRRKWTFVFIEMRTFAFSLAFPG